MTSEKTVFELIRNNKGIASAAAIFTLLSIMYFFPPEDLKAGFPGFIVDYRVAWPLLTLTIASGFLVSWPIAFAMLFSFAGDFFGAYGSFVCQMASRRRTHSSSISSPQDSKPSQP